MFGRAPSSEAFFLSGSGISDLNITAFLPANWILPLIPGEEILIRVLVDPGTCIVLPFPLS